MNLCQVRSTMLVFANLVSYYTKSQFYYGPRIEPGLHIRIQPIKSGAGNLF